MQSTSRAEAERLLGIAEKLLQSKDLNGCRDFALLAQETEPLLEGSDQILAIIDVLSASDKRINNHHDWYAILQLDSRKHNDDVIKRQYRRLALLLHPDKNKYPFADVAFKHVSDAWAVFSDASRKTVYDNELFTFKKVDLVPNNNNNNKQSNLRDKIPVRRNAADAGGTTEDKTIWTTCPYCYNLYEYPKMYGGCCLRCLNCRRAFQAVEIPVASLPPVIPGKEAYYCCWSYFPMGFAMANSESLKSLTVLNTMPTMFPSNAKAWPAPETLPNGASVPLADPAEVFVASTPPPVVRPAAATQKMPMTVTPPTAGGTVPRKRGRPRKNP